MMVSCLCPQATNALIVESGLQRPLPANAVVSIDGTSSTEFGKVCTGLIGRGVAGSFHPPPIESPRSFSSANRCHSLPEKGSTAIESITVDSLAGELRQASQYHRHNNRHHRHHHRQSAVAAVVDCRGFMAFNANHIRNAFNVSCGDRFTRRRLLDGKLTVADLVSSGPADEEDEGIERQLPTESPRETFRKVLRTATDDLHQRLAVVAYDDNSTNLMTLPSTHPLRLITDNLQKLGIQVQFLLGGLKAFHAAYPELCSKPSKPLSPPFIFSPTTPVVEMDVDSAEIAEIAPHVFLGNERDASNRELLNKYSINHVLNVTSNIPTHFDTDSSMSYKRLQASDSGCQNLKQYFGEAIAFIESARTQGGRVLVHCQAGVSRSATIVIAYLMARYDWTMMAAFHYVKSRRSIIAPNFNFMGQLLEFEQACQDGLAKRYLDDQTPSATPSLGLQVAMDCGPSSI